jgi:predicted FMN-binding regulatory protein PaiB
VYRPAHFAEDRVEILQALMRAHPFATLASRADGDLVADHLPLQLSPDGRRLLGHVARANPLWKMAAGQEVLAIFQGPQAYVSPSWYATKREHGKAVPTWNYVVVHAHGRLAAIDDPKRLRAMLDDLVDHHEAEFARALVCRRCAARLHRQDARRHCWHRDHDHRARRASGRSARTSPPPIAPASSSVCASAARTSAMPWRRWSPVPGEPSRDG